MGGSFYLRPSSRQIPPLIEVAVSLSPRRQSGACYTYLIGESVHSHSHGSCFPSLFNFLSLSGSGLGWGFVVVPDSQGHTCITYKKGFEK